jgi:hypothetical protein
MAAFLLALGAGAVFALGTVLQQREAMTESEAEAGEKGICAGDDGKVAWFKDPDGNTLSVNQ